MHHRVSIKTTTDNLLDGFDENRFEIAVGQIRLAVARGNCDLARSVLEGFMASARRTEAVTLDSPITLLRLPLRMTNNLEKHGYATCRSLVKATDDELRAVPDIFESSLRQIRKAIGEAKLVPASKLDRLLGGGG